MNVRIATGSLLWSIFLVTTAEARQGSWATGYDHPWSSNPPGWPLKFEAINMAVIPIVGTGGPTSPGKVIVWDKQDNTSASLPPPPWNQRYSVGAPEASNSWLNYSVQIPLGYGDLFCAGQTWMPDGRLFVAGGTTQYPDYFVTPPITNFLGSTVAAIWDPSSNTWTFLPPMKLGRWYPTVTLLGNYTIMVSGGVVDTANRQWGPPSVTLPPVDRAADTYEVWDINSNSWLTGPISPGVFEGPDYSNQNTSFGGFSMFGEYPRQHLLSSGHLFVSGMYAGANRVHPTVHGSWLARTPINNILDTGSYRSYDSSVLVPNVGRIPANVDQVMILGGSLGGGFSATEIVQICDGFNGLGPSAWSPFATSTANPSAFPSLNVARQVANTVLLPDGAILVIGGSTGLDYFDVFNAGFLPTPELRPEIYRKSVNAWVLQSPQASNRMYHSTAALLPSGKVVSAGGDENASLVPALTRLWDYEVFTPDYLIPPGSRPAFSATVGPNLAFNTIYQISYTAMSPGLHVDRVVLMRPCSVTHHSDMDQRYVELEIVSVFPPPPPNTISVKTPPGPNPFGITQGSVVAPHGWYMMFLISNTGKPSIAQWVRLT